LPNNINEVRKKYESPPQLINVSTLPCKMKRSHSRYTTTPKRQNSTKQKSVSAYRWVA